MKAKVVKWIVFLLILSSCKDNDPNKSEWEKLKSSPYGSTETCDAVLGNKSYVMFGYKYGYGFSREVWAYNLVNNTWESKQWGDSARSNSMSFTIGENIYVVGGYTEKLVGSDFQYVGLEKVIKYNPSSDTWTELDKFPGEVRDDGIVQVFNEKAYYGLGRGKGALRDFWMFDPSKNEWARLSDFPGSLIEQGMSYKFASFLFDNEIVVITGKTATEPEMWSYNILANEWKQITNLNFEDPEIEDLLRCKTRTVSVNYNGKGYLFLGKWASDPYDILNPDVYQYTPETSTWKNVGRFPEDESLICTFSAVVEDGIIFGTNSNETWKYRPKQ